MKKKFISAILATTLLVSGNMCVSAQVQDSHQTKDTSVILEADSIPVQEGISTKAVSLVASDVIHYYSGFGSYTYAWGYTDVRNSNGTDAYHYTRAEVQKNGITKATSGNVYGTGYVEAESNDCENGTSSGHVAKVFWGTK